jgi:C4-dicarboxylate-specific signal transduction histidine kinase
MFGPSPGYFQSPAYIIIQIFSLAAVLFFIIENYGTFSATLRKKQEGWIKAQEEVEEARKVLEIKVKARTRELQDLTERQEDIIEERSRETRERMEELEKFQKLSVGRELKMIELKEEIKALKNQLGILDNKKY